MKFLLTGKNGQLCNEFEKSFLANNIDYIAFTHKELDITDLSKLINVIKEIKPDIVINTAAYNQVDLAEKNTIDAFKTNSLGVHNLEYAKLIKNYFLVHYSSDYVFDGKKGAIYSEEDMVNPLCQYGHSKLVGESFIKVNSLLFRLSWVYGSGKQNFIYKFLNWTKNNSELKITQDEVSIPTSTSLIVDLTLKSLKERLTGIYHLTNSGYCSRYDLANYLINYKGLNNKIIPVSQSEFNLPAKRPIFSAMDNSKISKKLNLEIPNWQESLKYYLD